MDLYNPGISRGLREPDGEAVLLQAGTHRLPFGEEPFHRDGNVPELAGHPRDAGDDPAGFDDASPQPGAHDRGDRRVEGRVGTEVAVVRVEGGGVAVVPSFAMRACAKRAVTMHPLIAPQVSGTEYWLSSRSRKLPEGADAFNVFLKDYTTALICEAPRAEAA